MIKMKERGLGVKKFYTTDEVAALLKVSYLTVFRWIQAGKLSTYKVGNRYRIEISDSNNFLTKNNL